MNIGHLFQGVNISELMKNLDILGDNGVTMSGRFPVPCPCFDCVALFFVFNFFFSDLRDLRSTREGFCMAVSLCGWWGLYLSEWGSELRTALPICE
jgi:hypothetical protein